MWRSVLFVTGAMAMASTAAGDSAAPSAAGDDGLAPVESFAAIADGTERSVALFEEVAKVLEHPRCMNCHPSGPSPTQGDDLHAHEPPIVGAAADDGAIGHGPRGLPCNACHGVGNFATGSDGIASVPGSAHWGLAPATMAWQGLSTREICEQLKDPQRNGGRDLAAIDRHMSTDHLVGWAWHPGEGRTAAPGTQVRFGQLVSAWIATGAACPEA